MLADLDRFTAVAQGERGGFFDAQRPITIARAPASLDVIGGSAEHSGATVLRLPLAAAALVAIQPDPEPCIRVRYLSAAKDSAACDAELPLATLAPDGEPHSYAAWRAEAQSIASPQVSMVFGCWLVLMREEFVRFAEGARVLLQLDAPWAGGLGGAAALAAATLHALCTACGVRLSPRETALHGQTVLERVVGMPSGVADAAAALFGSAGNLLTVHCQPCSIGLNHHLPHDLALWGIALGTQDDAGTAAEARIGALMGARMLAARLADVTRAPVERSLAEQRALRALHGALQQAYLAQLTPSEFAHTQQPYLPEQMDGAAFLARYGPLADPLPPLDPARSYAVRAATQHAITEHFRTRSFAALLHAARGETREEAFLLLGELLAQSHESAARCGFGSTTAQALVARLRAAGPAQGIFGTRCSGDGSSVTVLSRANAGAAVQAIAAQHTAAHGQEAQVFGGSSPGVEVRGV